VRNRRPRHDRGHDPRPDATNLPWESPAAVADAELGARLERALREGPGSGHVDVAQLLRGTRQATTKRARARRTVMIAATAVAVGAVPVGLQTARWMSQPPVVPGTGLATGPTPTPTPTATPSRPPEQTTQPPEALPTSRLGRPLGDDPKAVLYKIPDSVAFTATDFTSANLLVPMSAVLNLGQYRWIPTVYGQECNETRLTKLEQPVAGRAWSWLGDAESGRRDALQVELSVTGWASDKSAELQLALVRRDTGACRFAHRVQPESSGERSWLAAATREDGVSQVYAATVVPGGLVVGLTITGSESPDEAVKSASTLIQVAVRNLERSGLTKELMQLQASGRQAGSSGAPAPESGTGDGAVDPNPAATTPGE
jgi:hypothetical protein